MHTVVQTDIGIVELNWQWLPTWIGMNHNLKKELEEKLKADIVGLTVDGPGLEKIDNLVIDFLVTKAPAISGLREYLEGLKFVRYEKK